MNFLIEPTQNFKSNFKRLIKKYPSLKKDVDFLRKLLLQTPNFGTPLGKDCYKIRLKITSKGRGKSGGARRFAVAIITCVKITKTTIYLLSIYDKADKENLTDTELEAYLKEL